MRREMADAGEIPQRDPHQEYVQDRPAPRCYTPARAATESRDNVEGSTVLLLFSVMTAVAAFWLVYRGWTC
jgi:hypothetical protein